VSRSLQVAEPPPSADAADREWEGDIVDVRRLPGVRYNAHTSAHSLNFSRVPVPYRDALKRFLRGKLANEWSFSAARKCLGATRDLLVWVEARHPGRGTLRPLNKGDIDAYLQHLRGMHDRYGKERSAAVIWNAIHCPTPFLRYLQRSDSPLAPADPIDTIVWPEHAGAKPQGNPNLIKHIPHVVLRQLDAHLHDLPEPYRPVVILLRATGWRSADILNLRHDTCLARTFNEAAQAWDWDLVGDIQKTRIVGHRVPIAEDVAALVQAQVAAVRRMPPEENPKRYLFPAITTQRRGRPLLEKQVANALNRLAQRHEIRGEDGRIFHFKAHAFRHSKAVELINNGMPLASVQQWMGHLSPEMTMLYARIQSDTLRRQWEKTTANGIVRFDDGRPEYLDGRRALTVLGDDAFDPLRVRDNRINVKLPLGTCAKTDKIICRFFELPCFHCAAYVLTPDDLAALEAYEREVIARIELAEANGNNLWAEFNRQNLDTRIRPALALLRRGLTYAKGDKYDREYTPDEWARRQAHRRREEP
jgi:integrase